MLFDWTTEQKKLQFTKKRRLRKSGCRTRYRNCIFIFEHANLELPIRFLSKHFLLVVRYNNLNFMKEVWVLWLYIWKSSAYKWYLNYRICEINVITEKQKYKDWTAGHANTCRMEGWKEYQSIRKRNSHTVFRGKPYSMFLPVANKVEG